MARFFVNDGDAGTDGGELHPATTENVFLARLDRHIAERGDAPFCRMIAANGEQTVTWRALDIASRRFAATFAAAGLGPGAVVLIFARHDPALYGALFGAMRGGFIPSIMPCPSPRQDPGLYWAAHQALLDRGGIAAILADRDTFAAMAAAGLRLDGLTRIAIENVATVEGGLTPPLAASVALLQHSSGTTGLKKGVALTYAAIVAQIESYGRALDRAPDDVIVSWLPLYHDMGLIACAMLPAYEGIPIVHIDPFHWLARPGSLFDALARYRGTLAWLPNFAFEHLARAAEKLAPSRRDLSGVRAFIDCSEPCRTASIDRFLAAFADWGVRPSQVHCCYAMAETVFAVTQTRLGTVPRRLRVATDRLARGQDPVSAAGGATELLESGTPIGGVTISIHDERRDTLRGSAVGEIAIEAPFLFTGYNRDPARTERQRVAGRYFSGDLGFLHEGHLYVLGRVDDVIIVNGRNLHAHEIEACVGAIDGVKPGRAVALGPYDETVGTATLIVVCERAESGARAIGEIRRDIVAAIGATFAVTPRDVAIVSAGWLIKTTSGKLNRAANLARYRARLAPPETG